MDPVHQTEPSPRRAHHAAPARPEGPLPGADSRADSLPRRPGRVGA